MKGIVDKLSYEEELVRDEIQYLVQKNTRDMDLEVRNLFLDLIQFQILIFANSKFMYYPQTIIHLSLQNITSDITWTCDGNGNSF